jgi:hypothetical protein
MTNYQRPPKWHYEEVTTRHKTITRTLDAHELAQCVRLCLGATGKVAFIVESGQVTKAVLTQCIVVAEDNT